MEYLFEGETDFQHLYIDDEDGVLIKSVHEKHLDNGDTFTGELDMVTGDMVNGIRVYKKPKEQYDGHFGQYGMRHGEGYYRQLTGEGCKFVGSFKEDQFENGTLLTKAFTYNGDFKGGSFSNPVFDGHGIMAFRDKVIYEGDFQEGDFEGLGTLTSATGDTYNGMFHNGKKCGLGTMKYADGGRYTGDWKNDLRHGEGLWTTAKKERIYRGGFKLDKPHGQGSMKIGNLQMKGSWEEGRPNDGPDWTLKYLETGIVFRGSIKCSRPHGQGTLTCAASKERDLLLFSGNFCCGLPVLTGLPDFSDGIDGGEDDCSKNTINIKESQQKDVEEEIQQFFDLSSNNGKALSSITELKKKLVFSPDWATNMSKILASRDGEISCNLTKMLIKKGDNDKANITLIDGSIYDGPIKNGLMNGDATFFDSFNDSRYVGTFLEGVKHGEGKEYYRDGSVYSGKFINGWREGLGELHDSKGQLFYKGEWKRDYIHGKGLCKFDKTFPCPGLYEGEFKHGHRDGRGTVTSSDGISYEGDWKNGMPINGEWVVNYPSGSIYFGNASFADYSSPPLAAGFGSLREASGTFYRGEFLSGKRHGFGVCLLASGKTLDGKWEYDKFMKK
mmetsp:Transcript_32842/g.49538  ORF Transcript_32842/g.49538 Transcript_32842/m.49538 type:complete len:613 (+) Transcript_32842:162-2000(+)|eukprot:CAMPEP_0178925088 /NCGR_PEP_ID=MMETSP0786-20121207/17702_1 /TAXON_ID=186022 /ORGANISM="Thalassionema frauenfeldii, Strain CCMP 1798" /LENGTH=612 /DNA_ID=CAMNT_0020599899 /DNA_START=76 /DNA_END=1914 /DNA_ORIENTATION=-